MWRTQNESTIERTASTGPLITAILSQESQHLFHADARPHQANAQAFPDIGMGRKYYLHDFATVDVAVHSVTSGRGHILVDEVFAPSSVT
jgi:hypothetical protein